MQVTIFTANCIGQAANCSYPNKVTVVTPEQLREAVKADHVCAEYKGNYRGIGNFIRSDVIVMDIVMTIQRNRQSGLQLRSWRKYSRIWNICLLSADIICSKGGEVGQTEYHIYFPISEITDAEVYGN